MERVFIGTVDEWEDKRGSCVDKKVGKVLLFLVIEFLCVGSYMQSWVVLG